MHRCYKSLQSMEKGGECKKIPGHPGKISENRSLEEGKKPHREVPSFFIKEIKLRTAGI